MFFFYFDNFSAPQMSMLQMGHNIRNSSYFSWYNFQVTWVTPEFMGEATATLDIVTQKPYKSVSDVTMTATAAEARTLRFLSVKFAL